MAGGLEVLEVQNLRRRNRKIVFDLVLAEPRLAGAGRISSYSVTLNFKPASDNLKGRLVAADGAVVRGPLLLHRAGPTVPIQRTWVGSVDIDGNPTSLLLQIIAEPAQRWLEVQSQREPGSPPTPVAGFGYLGTAFGNLERGRLSGTELTGRLALDSGALSFELGLSGQRLVGTLERGGQHPADHPGACSHAGQAPSR